MQIMSSLGKIVVILSSCIVFVVLTGCVTTRQQLIDINTQMKAGSYEQAAQNAIANGRIDVDGKSSDLLWSLQAGAMLTLIGDYSRSNLIYDQAELLMKGEDTENILENSVEGMAAIFYNNSINGYEPAVYDSVMINTYKGLNCIFLHDWQGARIEFNRAADRQRRAEEFFKKKISEEQEKADEELKTVASRQKNTNSKKSKDEARSVINDNFSEMERWKVYGNYINPYTDYLHGLFFMLAGTGNSDYQRAVFSFNRVAGMHGKNKVISKDLTLAKKLQSGAWRRDRVRPQVWVIFENGFAPLTEEILIPIPLFLVTNEIAYSQIALPKIVEQRVAYSALEVSCGGKKLGKTVQIASMDRVIQSEFKKEFPLRVTKAIVSAFTKGAMQYVAQEKFGLLGAIGGTLYQATTTHVDNRTWTSLPKEIQALRIRRPSGNSLTLSAMGMPQPITVELPDSRYTLVYVKALGPYSQPALQIVGFNS